MTRQSVRERLAIALGTGDDSEWALANLLSYYSRGHVASWPGIGRITLAEADLLLREHGLMWERPGHGR